MRLLEDRAAAQGVPLAGDEPAAQVAGRICRRLDGIPLAIELAAARLRVMPAAELEARLDERFALLTGGSRAALPRQQTLRAMVDWSWELLRPAERAVLARLSVFAGGFGLAAAEAVAAGPDVPAGEVLGHLGALVDKSLVQFGDTGTGPGRYRLLETIRQYAAGQLDAQGPAAAGAARIAHRDYYLALAEAAAPQLAAHDQAEWLDRLDAELGNLRAAIAVSQAQADPAPGLRLATSLRVYWAARGHAAEGADALQALLDARPPRRRRCRAPGHWLRRPTFSSRRAATRSPRNTARKRWPLPAPPGMTTWSPSCCTSERWILLRQGQPGAALPLIEQGLGLARRLGELHLTARLLSARAYATYVAGDPAGAARDHAEALRLFRQAGDRLQAGTMLGNLGDYELWAGDLDAARRHLAESLDIARALNAPQRHRHRDVQPRPGRVPRRLAGRGRGLVRRITRPGPAHGDEAAIAYALIGLALAGHGGADPGWSARLHGAADQALADLGHALQPLEGPAGRPGPPAAARRDGRRGLRGRIRRGPCPRPGAGAGCARGARTQPPGKRGGGIR